MSVRTFQRWMAQGELGDRRKDAPRAPANKLSEAERAHLLEVANKPEFRDLSPHVLVPLLADQGIYLASESTFYRVLREARQVSHRTRARAPRPKPRELVARGANQVWCWDITYLPLEVRGQHVYLYMFEDVWSRKIVGWEVHEEEAMEHSSALIERLVFALEPAEQGLVLHSDNGGPMRGTMMKEKLEELGVLPSFSRARVSNDNAHSEALFRTVKYRAGYPERFAGVEEARAWVSDFVQWYNYVHLHSGIGFVTPHARHSGQDIAQLAARQEVYEAAREAHPKRFSQGVRKMARPDVVIMHKRNSSKPL